MRQTKNLRPWATRRYGCSRNPLALPTVTWPGSDALLQVFPREFSAWSSFSFAMSICGIYASLMATWVYGLQAGGAAAIMWSWIIGGAGSVLMALSLAEISSAYPIAGAMYSVLKYIAPENRVPLLCWLSGRSTSRRLLSCRTGTENRRRLGH